MLKIHAASFKDKYTYCGLKVERVDVERPYYSRSYRTTHTNWNRPITCKRCLNSWAYTN